MRLILIVFTLFVAYLTASALFDGSVGFLRLNSSPQNFYEAKKVAKKIFQNHRETLYCHCSYNHNNQINLNSCHMESAKYIARAHRMEWEHMMPVAYFGHSFACWTQSLCYRHGYAYHGRKCCEKIDKKFKKIEAELYNLWPAVGLINALRSNRPFSVLNKHQLTYGCSITIQKHSVEPADYAKGTIARAYLFMSYKYTIKLSESQRKLFESWDQQFPPSQWEKAWAKKIAYIEGYSNPWILRPRAEEPAIADGVI